MIKITLYENEINFNIKEKVDNSNVATASYEKDINVEDFKEINKFLEKLNLEKIYEFIKKSFELNYDDIIIEEESVKIKLIINIMDILTEEVYFEIPKIKISSDDEIFVLKESIKFLEMEKNNFQNEVKKLNESLEELKAKMEENQNKILNKIEQKEIASKNKDDELLNKISIVQEQIDAMKISDEYVKNKLILEKKEKEENQEKNKFSFIRCSSQNFDTIKFEINMILFETSIKFTIKEIQNNLESNPLLYLTNLNFDNFGKLSNIYKNAGGIEAIFRFLKELFDGKKDTIKKEKNNLLISIKYPLGNKEDEMTLKIAKQEICLEKTLDNINESLKKINKENIKIKEDFKKDLLEKVYPWKLLLE